MSDATAYALSLALLLVGAVIVPWLAMRALVPTLEASGRGLVDNYRGRPVVVGLGLVWPIWAIGLLTVGFIDSLYSSFFSADGVPIFSEFAVDALPFLLVLGAFALGMADDVFGSSADKGFRGHLAALSRGRPTTGALKLFGIGVLAAVSVVPELGEADASLWVVLGIWVLQVFAIGLTANLLNMMDLRPGRALKAYSLLVVVGCVLTGLSSAWSDVPYMVPIFLGPVVAIWGFDLDERGMLGDAGANAAGVLVGWLLAYTLVDWWWALAGYVAVALALNLASEKISFSAVIEKTAFLHWLDDLGRHAGRHVDEKSPTI